MALRNAWQNKVNHAMQQLALGFEGARTPAFEAPDIPPAIYGNNSENNAENISESIAEGNSSAAPQADLTVVSDQQLEDISVLAAPPYHIVRSRRRTLGITVHRGIVEVRAPLRAPKYWIDDFIVEKRHWISTQVSIQKKQLQDIYRIVDGAQLPVLGETITVQLSNRSIKNNQIIKRARCELRDKTLHLQIPAETAVIESNVDKNSDAEAAATKLFMPWIKTQAENYMSAASRQLANSMGLGKKLTSVKYRRTSSKWGHCTSDGVIQYNPLIVLAPLFVIDYIVAHEVCHLKHANHSKTYWKLVDKVCKQRVEAELWLKQHGHKLAIEISKAN